MSPDLPSEEMRSHIGKKLLFRVNGEKANEGKWIEAKVADTVIIKNAEKQERRYKVWLTLRHNGFEKRVMVTLNDRSKMENPLLIGRNFLHGDYLVDVSAKELD